MLNRSLINKKYPPLNFNIQKQRMILFAKATGQTDPVYFDESTAKAKGYPSLIATPTFLTVVIHEQDNPYEYLNDLSVDLGRILHVGQVYKYHEPIFADDIITMEGQIVNMFDKKDGALQFLEFESKYTNQKSVLVAESLSTMVVR